MYLTRIKLSKERLLSLPDNERAFFILGSRLLNDLCLFHKLAIYSNKEKKNIIERKAQNSQTFFIVMLLVGIVWEGWRMLDKKFFSSGVSAIHEDLLSPIGKESLNNLKKYFGRPTWMKDVRDTFAFHYGYTDEMTDLIKNLPEGEGYEFELYLSEVHSNCFYFFSSLLMSAAILKKFSTEDPLQALDLFFADSLDCARWFLDFLGDCLLIVAKRYFGDIGFDEVEIDDPPFIDDIYIPFFVKESPLPNKK